MEGSRIHTVWLAVAGLAVCAAGPATAGQVRAWGSNSDGQVAAVPAGNNYTAVAAGDAHGLALRSDGAIVAWGRNRNGQCNVPAGTYVTVAAGADFSLAIRTNGSLAAWGRDSDGQVSRVPPGNDFVAVEGGESFAVAMRKDGSLVAWGNDRRGQVSGVPKGTGFKAVVAGDCHGVALRANGTLVSWGYGAAVAGTPTGGSFTAVGAGGDFCVALRNDGALVWWGVDAHGYGVSKIPAGRDYIAVTAGYLHGVALRQDGSLIGWGAGTDDSGHPHWGQAKPPAGRGYTAVAGGLYFSLALVTEIVAVDIRDDFDDNRQGSLWRRITDDSAACWLEEANRRLEIRATAKARTASAYYFSNTWQLDPTKDFAFKVDFHYRLRTEPSGRVFVGLTPEADDYRRHHLTFGAGCSTLNPYVWFEAVTDAPTSFDFADRRTDGGLLYVSYEAATDRLYLSTTGYGAKNAWKVVSDLLRSAWRGRPLWLYLGGGSDGQEIRSGDAWLDNFVLDTGSPARPSLRRVYRFWSPVLQQHFYTIDISERDNLIRNYAKVWSYEGPVFQAAEALEAPGLAPVYRFWSTRGAGHFYTIDSTEASTLQAKYPHAWVFEGVAFFAYPEGRQPPTAKPVYQFRRPRNNSHFYTIDVVERDRLIKEFSAVYTLEGTAFYAFE